MEQPAADGEVPALDYTGWNGVDEMSSLCMSCGEEGTTRLMLHKIPHFRELIIASFECPACGERNNEVTFGGEIQPQGSICTLKVTDPKDLDRQLIKSDTATVTIPEIEFEIPAKTQKGEITTIEGLLRRAGENLSLYQEERMAQMPEVGQAVALVILALTQMAMGDGARLPFHLVINDPAGNSYVENPHAPAKDPHMETTHYRRTAEQDLSLGLQPEADGGVFKDDKESNYKALLTGARGFGQTDMAAAAANGGGDDGEVQLGRAAPVSIPSHCPHCGKEGESLTAVTDIPHFKEVLIMAFDCNFCGFRNNEVKAGGAVPDVGTEVTLRVEGPDDLKRDVLKSDSCLVQIPELDLELGCGTLGGVYTTVEGLVNKIYTNLRDNNPFAVGDSIELHHSGTNELTSRKDKFKVFLDRLLALSRGETLPFTLVLRDPLGNSFVSAPLGSFLPPEMDANLKMEDFERTWDDNEEFGLNDINTKDYETGNDSQEVILADRLTHVVKKGADHPNFFAKGVDDATPGGAALAPTAAAVAPSETATHGWVAMPAGDDAGTGTVVPVPVADGLLVGAADDLDLPWPGYGKRTFSERDLGLDFLPYEEFSGAKEGYVFRMGAKGLGYYADQ